MIGCTSGGRGGGGSGSRNPGFAASTTPISESVEMMTKHSWNDADEDDDVNPTTKLNVGMRRNDIENNGGTRIDDCEETRVRVHDDDENNGLTHAAPNIKLKKIPRNSSHPELDVPGIDESRKYLCGLSNFQVTFILGMMGFILFWLGLLLRIYLPDEFFS